MGNAHPITNIGIATALALSACAPLGSEANRDKPIDLRPPGIAKNGHSVDPLIVGDRLMSAGEHELALDAYLRAAHEHGMTHEVQSAIAVANINLGRLNQAEDILLGLTTEAPRNPGHWNNLGVVLLEQGKYGEARRIFERAFGLSNGARPEIRENLRVALAKMEEQEYTEEQNAFTLVREGGGTFRLTQWP